MNLTQTSSHDWHVQPFVKDQTAFRLSGALSIRPDSLRILNPLQNFGRPRNLLKLRVRATAVNPLRSQDFHLISTVRGVSIRRCCQAGRRTLYVYSASENALPRWIAKIPAHAEAEDSSKIKDHLEALLYAETLQGTLSPNANPGRGSIGGLLNLMPKTAAGIQQKMCIRDRASTMRP